MQHGKNAMHTGLKKIYRPKKSCHANVAVTQEMRTMTKAAVSVDW